MGLTTNQRRTLTVALVLNAIMFVIGSVAGIAAESSGLIADSLDMLADGDWTFRSLQNSRCEIEWKHSLAAGRRRLVDVVRRGLTGANPESSIMLSVAALSLLVNATVLHLLSRYRAGEVHLWATWIFTRVV